MCSNCPQRGKAVYAAPTFACAFPPVTRGRCPPGCLWLPCPQCPGCSAAWPQTLHLLCGKRSWSRANRWRWWQPESVQETDPEPVQPPRPQTEWSAEMPPLHRLCRTQATHQLQLFNIAATNHQELKYHLDKTKSHQRLTRHYAAWSSCCWIYFWCLCCFLLYWMYLM